MAKANKELKLREEIEEVVPVEDTTEQLEDFDAIIADLALQEEPDEEDAPVVDVIANELPEVVEVAKPIKKEVVTQQPFTQYVMEPELVTVLIRKDRKNCRIGKATYNFIKGETMKVNRDVLRILTEAELI